MTSSQLDSFLFQNVHTCCLLNAPQPGNILKKSIFFSHVKGRFQTVILTAAGAFHPGKVQASSWSCCFHEFQNLYQFLTCVGLLHCFYNVAHPPRYTAYLASTLMDNTCSTNKQIRSEIAIDRLQQTVAFIWTWNQADTAITSYVATINRIFSSAC